MRNSFFLICACFGSGERHVATPIPFLEGRLAATPTPQGFPRDNEDFSLPPSVGDQGGGEKGYVGYTGEGEEKNQTRQEEKQWTWPKMHWRDGRRQGRKGKNVNTLGEGQELIIQIKDLLWVEGESRIMVEASIQPPIPILTQWTLAYKQVSCLIPFFNGSSIF